MRPKCARHEELEARWVVLSSNPAPSDGAPPRLGCSGGVGWVEERNWYAACDQCGEDAIVNFERRVPISCLVPELR
jgi:hypothetical protein